MNPIKQPLSNVQLELLKTFSYHLSDKELIDFKNMIAQYFAQRATELADQVWDKKGWTDEDVDQMLQTKMRKAK